MTQKIALNSTYIKSQDVVCRQVEDEYIIIPVVGGIGNIDDCIFSMNRTGKVIWDMLDGTKNLNTIADNLILEYDLEKDQAEKDILGFLHELVSRNIAVKV